VCWDWEFCGGARARARPGLLGPDQTRYQIAKGSWGWAGSTNREGGSQSSSYLIIMRAGNPWHWHQCHQPPLHYACKPSPFWCQRQMWSFGSEQITQAWKRSMELEWNGRSDFIQREIIVKLTELSIPDLKFVIPGRRIRDLWLIFAEIADIFQNYSMFLSKTCK
jgi:hypothetical protein